MFVVSDFRRVTENEKSKKCHIISGRLGGLGPLDVLTNSTSVIRCQADIQLSCLVEKKEIPFHVYSRNLFSSERLNQSDCKIQAFQLCQSAFCPISNCTDNPLNFRQYGRQIILENSFLMVKLGSSVPLNSSCKLFILIMNYLQRLTTKLWKQAFLCFYQ